MLKKHTLLCALALCAAVNWACTDNERTEAGTDIKKIYLQLYSVREDIQSDFKATITEVAKAGYAGIEAAGYADGKFYGYSPEDFKESLEAVGLKALSSHAGLPLPPDVAKADWNEIWRWWDVAIAAHKVAGLKYIITASMPVPNTLADLKVYCNYYNTIGERCNAAGLKFGYHNHAFEYEEIEREVMYDYMLKNTDPDKVCFQMDVYWTVVGRKSPVEYFHAYPGRFQLLHLKDYKELGQSGMVGFDAILKNRTEAGTEHLIVEVEKYNYTPLESVRQSYEYLKNHPDF